MDYGMIGKIEKARIYAEERASRVQFESLRVRIDGDNHEHIVSYDEGTWGCDCTFFQTRNVCTHTMTMERVLQDMVHMGQPAA
ncbi:MAG: hypothetical protein R3272_03150 [Candidatus Promineifilaceae bacterium]|nr:hypothetical protein [Candidatus Promineifilaceae bacterium]